MAEFTITIANRRFDVTAPDAETALRAFRRPDPKEDEIVARGEFLPFTRTEGGDISMGLNQPLENLRQTLQDIFEGKRDPGSLQPSEILEFGMALTPQGSASRALRSVTPAPRPTEGLEAVQAAERIGVELPRAAASDFSSTQQVGQAVTRVPFAGEPLRDAAERSATQLTEAATRAGDIGTGSTEIAGAGVRRDVTDFIKARQDEVGAKFDEVGEVVSNTILTPLKRTREAAAQIQTERDTAKLGPSGAIARITAAISEERGLTFDGIKRLRTSIREALDNPGVLPAEIPQAELKRLMTALTKDLESAASRAGGKAGRDKFKEANTFAAEAAREREVLARALGTNQSDEQIFSRVLAASGQIGKADLATLRKVRGALSDESVDDFLSAFIARIGRDPDGNFSPQRFLGPNGINKISKEAREILFSGRGDLNKSLKDIAAVSRRFTQLQKFANPSGTSQSAFTLAAGGGLVVDPVTTIATLVGGNVLARILAKPASSKAMAQFARANEAFIRRPGARASRALNLAMLRMAGILALETGRNEGELANELSIQMDPDRSPRGAEPPPSQGGLPGLGPNIGRSALRPGVT